MEKQITTEQIEKVKELAEDFGADNEKEFYVYKGEISASDYCRFLGLDYETVRLLGEVGYAMTYYETEDKKYQLACETYISSVVNNKLSFILEDSEDYLGFFTKAETKIGKAQWLPSNWKELITNEQLHDILQERNIQTIECLIDSDVPDEMKERIAREWCKDNSEELEQYLDDSDKEEIACGYIKTYPVESVEEAEDYLCDDDKKRFIIGWVDNL